MVGGKTRLPVLKNTAFSPILFALAEKEDNSCGVSKRIGKSQAVVYRQLIYLESEGYVRRGRLKKNSFVLALDKIMEDYSEFLTFHFNKTKEEWKTTGGDLEEKLKQDIGTVSIDIWLGNEILLDVVFASMWTAHVSKAKISLEGLFLNISRLMGMWSPAKYLTKRLAEKTSNQSEVAKVFKAMERDKKLIAFGKFCTFLDYLFQSPISALYVFKIYDDVFWKKYGAMVGTKRA